MGIATARLNSGFTMSARRVIHRLAAVALYLLISPACFAQSAPNIIVILTDDQGWTGTSVQMDPDLPDSKSDFYQTPNLERLAAQGVVFSDAYAPAAACSPTRASMLTGKSPAQLQMTDITIAGNLNSARFYEWYSGSSLTPPVVRAGLPEKEITIGEYIKQANPDYATASIGKWHVASEIDHSIGTPGSQGYDVYGYGTPTGGPDPKLLKSITNAANDFMGQQAAQNKPFYMQVNHITPHDPKAANPETVDKYKNLTPGERHFVPDFAAMIEDLDTSVGWLLDKVTELGLDDNTYIFFTSDNGGLNVPSYTNNTPLYNGKGSIYEGGTRVPMIVKGPGIQEGVYSDVPVSLYDYFPTIASLIQASNPLPQGIEGGDLTPLLFNGGQLPVGMDAIQRVNGPNGELFWHIPHYLIGGESTPHGAVPASAIRAGDYKLIKVYGHHDAPDSYLLFNLEQNITETYDPNSPLNLAQQMPEKVSELKTKLEAWLTAVDASQPYEVADDVELLWYAGLPGPEQDTWRSTINVNEYFRENWIRGTGSNNPLLAAIIGQPAGLAPQAFRFDGDDVMSHAFFRESDPKLPDVSDGEHSASFEFWLRLDSLDSEQILFESGDHTGGLSLTIGDADNDGLHDDLRFRILGADGNAISLTTPINLTTDPTAEFFQLAAVFSDDSTDRYLEIYINGQRLARINGEPGTDEFEWDRFDDAGLGNTAGNGLGANSGEGDLPFAGGGLQGELALFRYNNHTIDAAELLSRYLTIVGAIPGDLDGDGFVGISDLNLVLSNWNQNVPPGNTLLGDASGDGFIGIQDLTTVLGNWNLGSSPPVNTDIPEPSALALLGLSLAATVGKRRSSDRARL